MEDSEVEIGLEESRGEMLLNIRKNSSLEGEESQSLITTNVLLNPFSNKRATPEQQHHLLHFRQMGSVEFEKYIEYYILQQASVYVQNRNKHLLTFSDKRIGRSRVS